MSTGAAPDAATDADAFRRAWREGVPFTLLHDEAFVAEKYQEVKGTGDDADMDTPQLVSGHDGASMDELQHAADVARMRIFSKHRTPLAVAAGRARATSNGRVAAAASTSLSDGNSSSSATTDGDAAASALVSDQVLSRESAESVAAERLRRQRTEIAAHYFAQLAERLRAQDARGDSTLADTADCEPHTALSPHQVAPSATYLAAWSGSPSGVFAVSSFRVQLEMLREFRVSMPRLFESSVLAIVQTLLDFPPFALRSTTLTVAEQALVSDTHIFCRDVLDGSSSSNSGEDDLAESQRQATLLLLLALGVSSGRVSVLLDFSERLLLAQDQATQEANKQLLHSRTFASWIEVLLTRLEAYRVEVFLGVFEEDTLVKQFPVKLVRPGGSDQAESDKLPGTEAITTDGTFVYTWSLKTGLLKIGTGLNFTIAGRVYAESSASVYTESVQRRRDFRAALSGSGRDVTNMVRTELMKLEAAASKAAARRSICEVLTTGDLDDIISSFIPRRLFVVLSVGGEERTSILSDDDEFQSLLTLLKAAETRLLAAFYGDFEVLSRESIDLLRRRFQTRDTNAEDHESDGGSLLTVSMQLMSDLLPETTKSREISSVTELILFYSVEGDDEVVCHNYRVGDRISEVEDRDSDVYLSSMVLCGDSLYLSLLCTSSDRFNLENPKPEPKQKPRRMIRISSQDLSVVSVHSLRGDASSARSPSTKPLIVYVTEGVRIYEVEMSASLFNVQVFSPAVRANGSLEIEFVRAFPVNIDDIQSPQFVSYFLSLLSFELSPTDAIIDLPVLYTNGKWLGIVAPSSSDKAHCVMVDCDTGTFIVDKSGATRDSSLSSQPAPVKVKCHEVAVPGRLICYDARNNLLWTLDNEKGALTSFRNPGVRIPLTQRQTASQTLEQAAQGTALSVERPDMSTSTHIAFSATEVAGTRLLGFLSDNAETSDQAEWPSLFDSSAVGPAEIPFVADLHDASFSALLKLAARFSVSFQSDKASAVQSYCLQACLSILDTSVSLLLTRNGKGTAGIVKILRDELSPLLNDLIHPPQRDSSDELLQLASVHSEHSERLRLAVVSKALDLHATCTRIFHPDVVKQFDGVLKHLKAWENGKAGVTELKIVSRLLGHLSSRAKELQVGILASPDTFETFKRVVESAVAIQKQKLARVFEQPSAAASASSVDDSEAFGELILLLNSVSQSLFLSLDDSSPSVTSEQSLSVLSLFHTLCDACEGICAEVASRAGANSSRQTWFRAEQSLRKGIFGVLSPMLVSSGLVFLSDRERFRTHDSASVGHSRGDSALVEFLKEAAQKMTTLLRSVEAVSGMLDVRMKEQRVESVIVDFKVETMESAHEYENNYDDLKELRIAGATRIIVTFDAKSRTELNYDHVTFFKDRTKREFYGTGHYSGRDSEYTWPGVGANPPLVIESDHCFVAFHTDPSNTDWGYRFTAKGEILRKRTSVKRHWLVFLAESIVRVLDEIMRIFVDGSTFAPIGEAEFLNERVLQSDLLKGGISAEQSQNTNVLELLKAFANPPENSRAEKVVNALKNRSGMRHQQTSSSSFSSASELSASRGINSAVQSVAAAILHHNMWGMDAYAFAEDLRSDVSDQLLRGWKNAQKMRDWFHLGDAADAGMQRPATPTRRRSRKLRRQPSAFKGISEESLQILCEKVAERARFLLDLTPASFAYVSGAKRRWGLLAKYGHAIGKMGSAESAIDKWYNLLDELQAATELRSLFQYRRNSSERMRGGQIKSVTEQVLEFIQSDVDIDELRGIIETRNARARSRAFGIDLFARTWSCCSSLQMKAALVESFASTMRKLAQTHTFVNGSSQSVPARVHFATKLSGCQESLRHQVSESYGRCLREFAETLVAVPLEESQCSLIVAILKACALDYDVEDSYLLHESRILAQVLRVLPSEISQIRRAAQSVLGVFLARFVVGKSSSNADSSEQESSDDVLEATTFQRQLFTAVGLQLENVSSAVATFGETSSSSDTVDLMQTGETKHYNLADASPGLTAPCLENYRIGWNHTIMLWVYVHGESNLYALKVGDEVRRGPAWKDSNDEADGRDQATGVVTAIVQPTKVEVRWGDSGAGEYVFDPSSETFEVVLADQSVGGVIYCKGNKSLVKDTAFAAPWSSFGLFLSDQRELSYKISCGGDRECVYNSNYELDTNEWSHVAIAQDGDTLKVYVNGILASHHLLDPFLMMHGDVSASESKIVESAHPYPDTVDQYWPVHIPGASKIRVTFDPLCDIDQSTGFVRFYKNARCNEYWGDEKYSGKYHDPERNFPGAQSQRYRGRRNSGAGLAGTTANSVEIPSDRFLVYFHNESASNGWGFRLLAVPQFPASGDGGSNGLSLNPYPLYFGEPPSRVLDEPAAKCSIFQPKVCAFAASENDIAAELQKTSSAMEQAPSTHPSDRVLHILSLLQMCSETPFGRSLIGTPENLGHLLVLAFGERVPVALRCASVAVLRELAESLSPEIAAAQVKRVFPQLRCGLVEHVFSQIGELLNVWRLYADEEAACQSGSDRKDGVAEPVSVELRISAQEATSLASAYISLLRVMSGHFDWSTLVFQLISESLAGARLLTTATSDPKAVERAIASCALLGGTYDGITMGGRVTCCVNIDGKETVETGYLLQFRIKNGVRVAQVLFDCDRSHPIDVPVTDIAHLENEELEELQLFHEHMSLFVGDIKALFVEVLQLDVSSNSGCKMYKPKVTRKENVEVLESEHPYCSGEDVTYPLSFGEAKEIVIYFDKASCTAGPNDYVSFLKRSGSEGNGGKSSRSREYWGEHKYYGDNFPGLGNVPPLRIPASSVDVYFHTDTSASRDPIEWGFKLTAHAFEDTLSFPPEIPPLVTASALCDVRTRCVKAISSFFQLQRNSESLSDFAALIPSLTKIANEPSEGRPTCSTPRSQVFESKHPYSSSVLEYMEVVFRGASRLTVTFDPQSRTELNCDYLSFFKDRSLTERWGANQYSGDDDSANWPGVNGRPPLVIPGESFTLFWCTDVSNVDWGWKFTVTAEFKPVSPLSLSLQQLDKRAYQMFEIMYEKLKPQRTPYPAEFDGYEEVAGEDERAAHRWRNDPLHRFVSTSAGTEACDTGSPSRPRQQWFTVVDKAGVTVYKDRKSEVIDQVIATGERFQAVSQGDGWLEILSADLTCTDAERGWVRQRTADNVHVVSLDGLTRHENLLVMGVDDSRMEAHYSILEMSESNEEQEALANFSSQFALENLKGQCSRFQSFTYDTHRALATKCARAAIVDLLSGRLSAETIQLSDFGDENQFLVLLSHVFADDISDVNADSGTAALLANTMRQLASDPVNAEFLERSVNRCFLLLRQGAKLLPAERGALRVIESEHPYSGNTDQHWQVSIPGANKIVVTCDSRSKCENVNAWLRFYKDGSNRLETHGESEYGGQGDNENWPGCNGRPPLVIPADSFEAHFHSESSQSDWGFKLYAIGIYDDVGLPRAASDAQSVDAKSAMQVVKVCCWLLEVLSAELSRRDLALAKTLYSSHALETLLFSLEAFPQLLKPSLVMVVANLAQNPACFHSLPHDVVERVRDFVNVKMSVRYKVEEASELKSRFLQTLVQCAISIDLAIESGRFSRSLSSPIKAGAPQQLTLLEVRSSTGSCVWAADAYRSSALHQYQLLLENVTLPFSAVIWARVQHSERAYKFVEWNDDGDVSIHDTKKNDRVKFAQLSSCIRSGDTISFQLDFEHQRLVLRKNGLVVGVISACEKPSAIANWTALSMSSFADKSLGIGAISAGSQDNILGWSVSASPLALLPASVAPTWYSKLVDSVATALAFRDHGAPSVAIRESAHPMRGEDRSSVASDEIKFPGAIALELKFDRRTKLQPNDEVEVSWHDVHADAEKQSVSFVGLSGEEICLKTPLLFLSDGHKRRNDLARVGDLVVRSRDWEYGDEDGGIGSVGIVQEIVSWSGQTGTGVSVRWRATGQQNVYRCGFEGRFDVRLLSRATYRDHPLLIRGEALSYSFRAVDDLSSVGASRSTTGDEPHTFSTSARSDEVANAGREASVANTVSVSNVELAFEPSEAAPRVELAKQASAWGYRFYVIPHYSKETIGHERFQEPVARFGEAGLHTQLRHDRHLVKYVNHVAQAKHMSVSMLLRALWSDIAPRAEELMRWPVLLEIATGVASDPESAHKQSDAASVNEVSQESLAKRFKMLQDFNVAIHRLMPYVSFSTPTPRGSASSDPSRLFSELVSAQRDSVFNLVKRVVWDDALERTTQTSVALELTLNRPKAMRHRSSGKVDSDARYTLFSQAFRQLNSLGGGHYRRADNFYHVVFLGENAQDAGGPYRETLAQYCEELHSSQLPLLLPTSNSQHNVGVGREKWVVNPGASNATMLHMYEFLGKLMGVVLRSKQYLPLNIASLIWKKLVGEEVRVDDLAAVDSMIVNSMHKMRTIDKFGVTEEMFEDIVLEVFTTLSSDNRVVPLKPDGQSVAVTFANRCEYADLVERYRFQEFDLQIAALFRGISTVVPAKILSCFTGLELELMVCGSPEVDVGLLERCTEYSSCSASDEHIVWFWQVLREFSQDERSAFLRFVWGRSRLPANEKEFPQLFKLQSFSKAQPGQSVDGYLPIAHTCFFSVEMPAYSSEQVLRDKLLYAIYNCQEIDGDGDSVAANQLGWEE